jgi:hypothetical protein
MTRVMTFSRRNEQELAEIKQLARELDERVRQGLDQLKGIRATQERLAGHGPTRDAPSTEPAVSAAADRPVASTSRPERRGGIGARVRRMIYGPEIELPGAAEHRPQASAPLRENVNAPLLAFVHIPKTAGGTATTMFARAYSRSGIRDGGNYLRSPERAVNAVANPRKHEARVIAGHVPYGVYREHLPPDSRYMTFLREPVDRVLSHYYRHMHRPDLSLADRRKADRVRALAGSLEEAMVELRFPQVNNLATRFLCGDPSPLGELPATALDDAKASLREFAFVGIQERFEESIVLLQRALGLELTPYLNRHVSAEGGRPTVEEISAEQRALIIECNRLDVELYDFGLQLFEEAVAAADDAFADDVETLRAMSADANAEAIETARIWLERDAPAGAVPAGTLRPAAREAGVQIAALKLVIKDLPETHRVFMRNGEKA